MSENQPIRALVMSLTNTSHMIIFYYWMFKNWRSGTNHLGCFWWNATIKEIIAKTGVIFIFRLPPAFRVWYTSAGSLPEQRLVIGPIPLNGVYFELIAKTTPRRVFFRGLLQIFRPASLTIYIGVWEDTHGLNCKYPGELHTFPCTFSTRNLYGVAKARRVLSRMILARCFSRQSSVSKMSSYESKPDTSSRPGRLVLVIELI